MASGVLSSSGGFSLIFVKPLLDARRRRTWSREAPWRASMQEARRAMVIALCSRGTSLADEGLLDGNPVVSRRIATALAGLLLTSTAQRSLAEQEDNADARALSLERYDDEREGFTLLRPADWNKVEKAGATLLFEDPVTRSNTVGVVVNPVRIASLRDFGTPDQVAERLIQAEKKKESTNDAKLVRVGERDANGRPLYEVEYSLDSSRGQKRVLSAVTIAARKLYILNVSYNDAPSKPIPQDLAVSLQRIVNSFNLLI